MNELMTRESGQMAALFRMLEHALDHIELLGGERYLTDREVAKLLKTCRRTLQEYRDAGRMSYIQLGGKILYRESDIERLLMEGYREAFRIGT